jgi:hypothetical protein
LQSIAGIADDHRESQSIWSTTSTLVGSSVYSGNQIAWKIQTTQWHLLWSFREHELEMGNCLSQHPGVSSPYNATSTELMQHYIIYPT